MADRRLSTRRDAALCSSAAAALAVADEEQSFDENTCENIPSYVMSDGPEDDGADAEVAHITSNNCNKASVTKNDATTASARGASADSKSRHVFEHFFDGRNNNNNYGFRRHHNHGGGGTAKEAARSKTSGAHADSESECGQLERSGSLMSSSTAMTTITRPSSSADGGGVGSTDLWMRTGGSFVSSRRPHHHRLLASTQSASSAHSSSSGSHVMMMMAPRPQHDHDDGQQQDHDDHQQHGRSNKHHLLYQLRHEQQYMLGSGAMSSSNNKAATIRQHYYPEGGWGWVVLACATASHALGAGLQLAYGQMLVAMRDRFANGGTALHSTSNRLQQGGHQPAEPRTSSTSGAADAAAAVAQPSASSSSTGPGTFVVDGDENDDGPYHSGPSLVSLGMSLLRIVIR
jgi:hypothetical protein